MKQRHNVIPRTLSFIFCNDEVLLIKYAAHKQKGFAGMYNGLGGHVEKGEDVAGSARREIKEEAGIKVEPALRGIVHVTGFQNKNVLLFIYTARVESQTVKASDEGSLEWKKVSDLQSVNIFSDVAQILSTIAGLKPNEQFTGISTFDKMGKLSSITLHVHQLN